MPTKSLMQNVLENFLTGFGLGHFDEPKSREFEAL